MYNHEVDEWFFVIVYLYDEYNNTRKNKKLAHTHPLLEKKKNTNKNGVMTKKHTECCCLYVFTNDLAKLYEQVIHTHEKKTVHWTFS